VLEPSEALEQELPVDAEAEPPQVPECEVQLILEPQEASEQRKRGVQVVREVSGQQVPPLTVLAEQPLEHWAV